MDPTSNPVLINADEDLLLVSGLTSIISTFWLTSINVDQP